MGRGGGFQIPVTRLLEAMNLLGGYETSFVCTEQGLLVASASSDEVNSEEVAGFTGLFDSILTRAIRDLGFRRVDEVTLLDSTRDRLVIRPLPLEGRPRMFLVLRVPPKATWRRNTNKVCFQLADILAPLVASEDDDV